MAAVSGGLIYMSIEWISMLVANAKTELTEKL